MSYLLWGESSHSLELWGLISMWQQSQVARNRQTAGIFWATCCVQQMWLRATDISYDTLRDLLPATFLRCCGNKVA